MPEFAKPHAINMLNEILEVETITPNFQNPCDISKMSVTAAHAMPVELFKNDVFRRRKQRVEVVGDLNSLRAGEA